MPLENPKLCGASIATMQYVRASAILFLSIVRN